MKKFIAGGIAASAAIVGLASPAHAAATVISDQSIEHVTIVGSCGEFEPYGVSGTLHVRTSSVESAGLMKVSVHANAIDITATAAAGTFRLVGALDGSLVFTRGAAQGNLVLAVKAVSTDGSGQVYGGRVRIHLVQNANGEQTVDDVVFVIDAPCTTVVY